MVLSNEQLLALRKDLGAVGDTGHFTDAELQANATRVGESNVDATLGLCFRQQLAAYTQNVEVRGSEINVKAQQVMENLRVLYNIYRGALEQALDMTPDEVLFSGVGSTRDGYESMRGPEV